MGLHCSLTPGFPCSASSRNGIEPPLSYIETPAVADVMLLNYAPCPKILLFQAGYRRKES